MLTRQYLDERCSLNDPGRVREQRPNFREPTASENEAAIDSQVQLFSHLKRENEMGLGDGGDPTINVLRERMADDGHQRPPPYFPQPGDDIPAKADSTMGPIGPWATGRPIFSPTAGMTGVRPVVDRYSITRYSPAQWRAHNQRFFDQNTEVTTSARDLASNIRKFNARIYKDTDKDQHENRDRLSKRAGEIHQWKTELQQALLEITDEIELLEGELRRVKQSLSVLTIPESICGEFLQLRTARLEPDLVRDDVEEELIKEVALCAEVRNMLNKTGESVRIQLLELKTAKARLELDLTDKIDAYEIDSSCIGLTNDSPLVMMKPGATRVPPEQSSPAGYEHFTKEGLENADKIRKQSVELRETLDTIFLNVVKELRNQAVKVNSALDQKVAVTEQICQEMEKELTKCLHEITNTEKLIEELRGATKGLREAMKVAQTRLGNRLERKNVENCRDEAQYGLLEEVKKIRENLSAMAGELKRAEESQAALVKSRCDLECEIMVKRKTLYVDRDRGQLLRSFYPSSEALSGRV